MPPPLMDSALLHQLVAEAWCMTDFLLRCSIENNRVNRRTMWARLDRAGVDVAHWDRSPRRWYTDDALAAAAAASTSVAGTLRTLGIPVTGGQHAHIARRLRRAGIDTSHFLGQAHNRGSSPQRRSPSDVLVLLPPGSDRPKTTTLRTAMRRIGIPQVCAVCGSGATWQGARLTLMIDHISGDWLDNRPPNLRLLCPNCHSQTPTWCRKRAPAA